jgi:mannitol-1-phosphate 5-dehydrogenase
MVNPHLRDRTERVTRDPRRKLGWEDRLIGTMRLALDAGVEPRRFALGAAAAWAALGARGQLDELWPAADEPSGRKAVLVRLVTAAQARLRSQNPFV